MERGWRGKVGQRICPTIRNGLSAERASLITRKEERKESFHSSGGKKHLSSITGSDRRPVSSGSFILEFAEKNDKNEVRKRQEG